MCVSSRAFVCLSVCACVFVVFVSCLCVSSVFCRCVFVLLLPCCCLCLLGLCGLFVFYCVHCSVALFVPSVVDACLSCV